jgi:hypothetical protein
MMATATFAPVAGALQQRLPARTLKRMRTAAPTLLVAWTLLALGADAIAIDIPEISEWW